MATTDLTPTEELAMELIAARARLGAPFWTFSYRHRTTLGRLEAKGLIRTEPAVTEHIEAYLMPAAREKWLSLTYTPPGARVEWGASDGDDPRPVHYVLRGMGDAAADEDYHRRYAARNGGALYRRWSVTSDWVQVPMEVRR